MAKHSDGEFASADPTTGVQDAGLQERRISAKISLNPRRRLQHLQRSTPPDLGFHAPGVSRRGDEHLAGGGRGCVRKYANGDFLSSRFNNVTEPDDAIVGHGISLLRWRSGGVEHPHDMPPSRFTPHQLSAIAPSCRGLGSVKSGVGVSLKTTFVGPEGS
jgi:hypothetical protein